MTDPFTPGSPPSSWPNGPATVRTHRGRSCAGEPFRIFYELYNPPAGRKYRTEITLSTTEGNAISRLFNGKTSTRATFEYRRTRRRCAGIAHHCSADQRG